MAAAVLAGVKRRELMVREVMVCVEALTEMLSTGVPAVIALTE